jgi:hypothetical protein
MSNHAAAIASHLGINIITALRFAQRAVMSAARTLLEEKRGWF